MCCLLFRVGQRPRWPDTLETGHPVRRSHAAFALRSATEDLVYRVELQVARRRHWRSATGGARQLHETRVFYV